MPIQIVSYVREDRKGAEFTSKNIFTCRHSAKHKYISTDESNNNTNSTERTQFNLSVICIVYTTNN